ncbi:MAG: bifunctional (p)ppGpp synthetase/guanosine-3',5'-bis(diphosphate) 3'-pyrophosphohydrolase [Syntrophomonadaceae bacterium]|nr:bifunctional (p)ppGpp synthetase/guanosine-3',5'-bis(diphosphate) 3'-pyrophosphohydrolase [Syntrophomonadaceae bacterium]
MGPEELLKKIRIYDDKADTALVEKAYLYAERAHAGQTRISGDPYIIHPLEVAVILADIEMDVSAICAALLHDVVEDTTVSYENILQDFDEEIATLVEGLTKLNKINFKSREEAQAENIRKMLIAMAKDIRVILIKLADRLHNMRTLNFQSEAKQKEIAQETLEIYAPLAHRLGVFKFKWELEDLAFAYLNPEVYFEIARRLKQKRREREEYVNDLIEQIRQGLKQIDIEADIHGRPKNIYSIYKKMVKQDKDIDEIYDKIAIRVLVADVQSCYGILGIIHTMWKPLPGRFKDYIATPKPNMYQSLHTTLIGKGGEPFEVQIRTFEMHRLAESGIAAHWRYKEGVSEVNSKVDEKLYWLRQILEWQQDIKDTKEFMESLKIDLYDDTVFVFTPKGSIVEMPKGSCPVDFAYRIHTEVGHRCTGAKVNGRIVPLDYILENGNIVEINTSKNSPGPTYGWLNFVRTSSAKNKIRQWFNREKRQGNLIKGHDAIEKELRKRHLNIKEFFKSNRMQDVGRKFGYNTADDLLVGIGDGFLTANQVINRHQEMFFPNATNVDEIITASSGVRDTPKEGTSLRVVGIDDVTIRLARCCNPLPGDPILGYITRGRGVSAHRKDCPNMLNYLKNEKERILEVEWVNNQKGTYVVEVEISALDRPRLTYDVLNEFAEAKIRVNSVFSRITKHNHALMNVKLEINDLERLQAVLHRIQRVSEVEGVRRVVPGDHREDI